jgi:hypothetical protein
MIFLERPIASLMAPIGGLQGAHEGAIDFDGDGALEKIDGNYQAVTAARTGQNALDVRKRSGVQSHTLPDFEERVRTAKSAGFDDGLNRFNLGVADRRGFIPETDDVFDVGSGEHGKTIAP